MKKYNISAFADEITPNFELQLQSLQKLGITNICLRLVDGRFIVEYDYQEVKDKILPLLKKYNITVSSIGSPIGKVDIRDQSAVQNQFDMMDNLVRVCQLLDVTYIRMFSYYNAENQGDLVVKNLKKLLTYVEGTNVILMHENEKDIYGSTAKKCLEIAKKVNNKNFKCVFDPANFIQVGDDVLEAFTLLEEYIVYLHLKDVVRETDKMVVLGKGDAHIKEVLQKALQINQTMYLTIEPHLVDFMGLTLLENRGDATNNETPDYTHSFNEFKRSYDALLQLLE